MPNLLTMTPLTQGFASTLVNQQVTGILDLVGLTIGIWTVWSSISFPLGGKLQRAFRLIGFGSLAFASSHLIDSLIVALRLANSIQALLLTLGMVLVSMLFFVSGLAGLADLLPALPAARRQAQFPRFWPLAVTVIILVGALSFILYGISPAAEIIAFIGLNSGITIMATLCIALLLRARIGGVIGRSLWLAMVGLLLFSLAHPLQVWLAEETSIPSSNLGLLHRLIVIPSLLLFALSISSVARKLSISLYIESTQTSILPSIQGSEYQNTTRWKAMDYISPRARARRNSERLRAARGINASRPFPASRQRPRQRA